MSTRVVVHYNKLTELIRTAQAESVVRSEANELASRLDVNVYTDSAIGDERARAAVIARGATMEETRAALLGML